MADLIEPVRRKLVGAIALEELLALDPAIEGEPQHAAFQADQLAVEIVELIDEFLDAQVMQVHVLQQRRPVHDEA